MTMGVQPKHGQIFNKRDFGIFFMGGGGVGGKVSHVCRCTLLVSVLWDVLRKLMINLLRVFMFIPLEEIREGYGSI